MYGLRSYDRQGERVVYPSEGAVPKRRRRHAKQKGPPVIYRCLVCEGNIDQNGFDGIICPGNHYICRGDCSQPFISFILEKPQNVPVSCRACRQHVKADTFERQLDDDQRPVYWHYVAMRQCLPGEKLVNCPFCSFYAYGNVQNHGEFLFSCRNETCLAKSCMHCRLEVLPPPDRGYSEAQIARKARDPREYKAHMIECVDLCSDKALFEDAIARGTGMECPGCKLVGTKDENCTHIVCVGCQMTYCYVCGLSEADVDKDLLEGNGIAAHNWDWEFNPLRCPLLMEEFHEYDERWPEDELECVAFFARLRTIKLLRAVVEQMGEDRYKLLRDKFASVRHCGFTPEEIIFSVDVTLFKLQEKPNEEAQEEEKQLDLEEQEEQDEQEEHVEMETEENEEEEESLEQDNSDDEDYMEGDNV